MIPPVSHLAEEIKRSGCYKHFFQYEKATIKCELNSLRIHFLEQCKRSELIPRFLKFRIPTNGCFDNKSVREFQLKLLHKELVRAKENFQSTEENVNNRKAKLLSHLPTELIPPVEDHIGRSRTKTRMERKAVHEKKLSNLSKEQEQPLFNVQNTVVTCDLEKQPPGYVLDTLSLGPKNATLDRFNPKDILAELDDLLRFCKRNSVLNDTITDINIKTLTYIKKCKKMKTPRHLMLTRKYLNDNKLLAVPFDKGIGFCIMKIDKYQEKLDAILNLSQFEGIPTMKRKNEKSPVIKEEERVRDALKELRNSEEIDESLYEKLKPIGSQPARLYGLAKVHKRNVPVRPVLSMPGSAYHKIGMQIAEWLTMVPECGINTSSKKIADSLKDVKLEENEEIVSFDVTSLYTNVPLTEAIHVCADMLYNGVNTAPPVSKQTFIRLAELSSCNVLMLTHKGYVKQVDGLAMGSPPAPHFANGWLSKYDEVIKADAKLYARYMDDIIQNMPTSEINQKLDDINNLHPSLKFTIERESDGQLPFLDMKILNVQGKLSSTWYNKPTDTGLIMNFHATAPKRYKRSVVSGFVHRIHRACSNWMNFHDSVEKAKKVLENNQYPPAFYNPIIEDTITRLINSNEEKERGEQKNADKDDNLQKKMIFIQYRGKVTEDYARALHRINAPATIVMTLRKLKTAMPSLKPKVEMSLRAGVVYQITCPCCGASYVGQSRRHLIARFREHVRPKGTMGKHLSECEGAPATITLEGNCKILAASMRDSESYLLTLEALWIDELKPALNTKDEFRSKVLTIKL